MGGCMIWDCIASGGGEAKEASKYATLWKNIIEVLRVMKAEKKAAAAACATFAPSPDSMSQAFPASMLFLTTLNIPSRAPNPPARFQ